MKANDPIVAADAVQALADAQREIREHLARCDDTPASASPAKLELTDLSLADHRQYLETAYSQGDVLIRLAEDHLVAYLFSVLGQDQCYGSRA